MRVRIVSPCFFQGRGLPIGEELDVDGEDLHLLIRAGRVEPVDKRGWIQQTKPGNITWQSSPEAEKFRGPAGDPFGGRTW